MSSDKSKYLISIFEPAGDSDDLPDYQDRDECFFVFPDDLTRPVNVSITSHFEDGTTCLLHFKIPNEYAESISASFSKRVPTQPIASTPQG